MKKYFARLQLDVKQALDNDLPLICGNEAARLFRQNFQKEGFFGKKWKEVQRRQERQVSYKTKSGIRTRTVGRAKGAAGSRSILTGNTGDLGRSIKVKRERGSTTVYSDLPYSSAHNDGGRSGRGKGFKMPRRQFIGEHAELQRAIKTKVDQYLKNKFK